MEAETLQAERLALRVEMSKNWSKLNPNEKRGHICMYNMNNTVLIAINPAKPLKKLYK